MFTLIFTFYCSFKKQFFEKSRYFYQTKYSKVFASNEISFDQFMQKKL